MPAVALVVRLHVDLQRVTSAACLRIDAVSP
ncbi:putative leader peptide [Jatrophihabitans sp.]